MFGDCEKCGWSLLEGEYVLPWEDGDNECAYTICPHCGHENIDWSTDDED